MSYDPVLRLPDLQFLAWGNAPPVANYCHGVFEQRNPLNVPGPFYGADTDTCCVGPVDAPLSVLYDADGQEFVWRQPRNDEETLALMRAAGDDPFHGYGYNGNAHWTPALVRQWWQDRDSRAQRVEAAQALWATAESYGDPERLPTSVADFTSYMESATLPADLRRYMFRLDNGRYPDHGERLPEL